MSQNAIFSSVYCMCGTPHLKTLPATRASKHQKSISEHEHLKTHVIMSRATHPRTVEASAKEPPATCSSLLIATDTAVGAVLCGGEDLLLRHRRRGHLRLGLIPNEHLVRISAQARRRERIQQA